MPKANIIITQENDGLWVIRRGDKTLVESYTDEAFLWKYDKHITGDDMSRFSTGNLIYVLRECKEL